MHAASVLRSSLALAAVLLTLAPPGRATAPNDDPRRMFADPPHEYHTLPFWVWNDDPTDEQVRFRMQDFADHGIRSVMVHPRPGPMTPYLSDRWFALWQPPAPGGSTSPSAGSRSPPPRARGRTR
jgi:hypothetical protein